MSFFHLQIGKREICFDVFMDRVGMVAGAQPVPVKVYDYYEPGKTGISRHFNSKTIGHINHNMHVSWLMSVMVKRNALLYFHLENNHTDNRSVKKLSVSAFL